MSRIACKLCGKEYSSGEKIAMSGHMMRNHPDDIPGLLDKLAPDEVTTTGIERMNKDGMYDHFLRALRKRRGVVEPPPVFPEADIVLPDGTRLAHGGRYDVAREVIRKWTNEEKGISVTASLGSADHVAVSRRFKSSPDISVAVLALFFGERASEVQRIDTEKATHLRCPSRVPPQNPYPATPDDPADMGAVKPRMPVVRTVPKVGRNEECPCGSRKKFKKCHGGMTVH